MTRRRTVYYKKGNTWPPIDDIITDRNGPVDLSAAITLRFLMRRDSPTGALVTTGTATAGNPTTTAANGGIRYLPVAADTNTVGTYLGEWEITFSGPKIATAPNKAGEYITVIVSEDLA